ncbi:MAG TPA: DNA repair protein RecO [Pirellulaceae bacterium]|nr:DNA repair protein RecO [Pirellulaceae bacterium]HMO91677.1 DNA repair protein RecO [Pirellulaceae bacterium]HMP68374.1 DNA repair protein RecO [Pirellulaceae bacterium]
MAAEKTLAIVLRVTEFSETSCVVTLFTQDFGKLSALAKGARRPKSPFEAALDVLSVCRVVFLQKSGDSLHLLTEAKLERRFRAGARNLESLYAAYYVVELLGRMTDHLDPHPELFRLAVSTIVELDSAIGEKHELHTTISILLMRFQMQMLSMLGQAPGLHACVECNANLEETIDKKRVAFGLNSGGILCAKCKRNDRRIISLSLSALQGLADAMGTNFGINDAAVRKLPLGEMRGLLDWYITHLLGIKPTILKFL